MSIDQRKHIRFEPDPNTHILLVVGNEKCLHGLATSEAQGGAAGVFIAHDYLKAGEMCYIKVGKLDALSAEIVWVEPLATDVVKVGFKYLS